jgi:hypothetical protein
MNTKFILAGILFVCVFLSGVGLSRMGRPLNVIILTIHKLISLAAVVYLGVTVYQMHPGGAPFSPLEVAACLVTLLLFLALFASGGLLSTPKPMPEVVLKIHQVLPYLVILVTPASVYLVLAGHP